MTPRPPSAIRLLRSAVAVSTLLFVVACYSFAGGGLPSHIRTAAVLPIDNETNQPDLPRELQEALRNELLGRLGLRDAPEARANALIRGTITRFESDIPVAFSSDPNRAVSARRRLRINVNIEIVDQVTGRTLWAKQGMQAEGEYAERDEAQGRQQAIARIVNDVIEGAQSQW